VTCRVRCPVIWSKWKLELVVSISAVNWDMSQPWIDVCWWNSVFGREWRNQIRNETGSSMELPRQPSWNCIWRHYSAADDLIWTNFDSPMQNSTPITVIWSKSQPEEEFQYDGRLFFQTGSSYISAVNWVMPTKFGL